MKAELEELENRVTQLENNLIESMRKDNEIHKLINKKIDLIEQRLSIHIHKTTNHGKDNLRS